MGWAVLAAPMIGSHMARRPATSPTAGGVKPDAAIGASAAAISGSKVSDMVAFSCWLLLGVSWCRGTSGGVREDDDLAGQRARGRLGVDHRQLCQRHPLGDVDAELAAVDHCHQPRQLFG